MSKRVAKCDIHIIEWCVKIYPAEKDRLSAGGLPGDAKDRAKGV